jgi:hypothetical protein
MQKIDYFKVPIQTAGLKERYIRPNMPEIDDEYRKCALCDKLYAEKGVCRNSNSQNPSRLNLCISICLHTVYVRSSTFSLNA